MPNQRRVLLLIALVVLLLAGGFAVWMILSNEDPAPNQIPQTVVDTQDDAVTPAPLVSAPAPEIVRPQPVMPAATRNTPHEGSKSDTPAAPTPAPQPAPPEDQPDVRPEDEIIVVDFVDKSFHTVAHYLALNTELNVIVQGEVKLHVTVLRKIPRTKEAAIELLTEICEMNDLSCTRNGDIVMIKNR